MENKIKFGWAETDITPNQKIRLAGQFYERISDEAETPITVTALAIECGKEQAVLCSCDVACISEGLLHAVREKLSAKSNGLDVSKIIIGATHTHTSYEYEETGPKGDGESDIDIIMRYAAKGKKYVSHVSGEALSPQDALIYLTEKIADTVMQAWDNRDYGYFANEFGRAAVGMCRRVVYDDGSAQMWGDSNKANFEMLEGGNDSGIEMLFVFDSKRKLSGILLNIACPAQVLEQRSFISADYWGKVKILLRDKFGKELHVLGLLSPAGDQCPRDLIRWVQPETPIDDPNVEPRRLSRKADPSMYDVKGTWKIGKRICNEVFDAFDEAARDMRGEAVFIHKTETLKLPLRRATITEYNEAVSKISEYFKNIEGDVDFKDNANLYIYSGTIKRFERQQHMNVVPAEVHVIRFGNMAFATSPFELFLDYGNKIRARSEADQTFLFQLTCGNMGYLPTKKAEAGSHYSAYISSGLVGHEGGDMLVRITLDYINNMFDK